MRRICVCAYCRVDRIEVIDLKAEEFTCPRCSSTQKVNDPVRQNIELLAVLVARRDRGFKTCDAAMVRAAEADMIGLMASAMDTLSLSLRS